MMMKTEDQVQLTHSRGEFYLNNIRCYQVYEVLISGTNQIDGENI